MEARRRADAVGLALERSTVGELRIFESFDGSKVAVDERGVGQRPQVFGGLQFRRIGR